MNNKLRATTTIYHRIPELSDSSLLALVAQWSRHLEVSPNAHHIRRQLIAACLEAERRGLSPTPPPTKLHAHKTD